MQDGTRDKRSLTEVSIAEFKCKPQVFCAKWFSFTALFGFDREFARGTAHKLALFRQPFFSCLFLFEVTRADVAGAVAADFSEEVCEGFFDVGFGCNVEVVGAVGRVALGEAVFVAYREEAIGYCHGGGEFVGFDVEGGCVALADFEFPVYGSYQYAQIANLYGDDGMS